MKRTRGSVFQRGRAWWAAYAINHQRFRFRIMDRDGKPVTSREAAMAELDRLIRPYTAIDERDRRQLAADALRTADQIATDAIADAKPRMPIAKAWETFPYTETSRGRGARRKLSPKTASDTAAHWRRFAEWSAARKLVAMEDVTAEHAAEFSRYLRDDEKLTTNRHNKIMRTCGVVFRLAGRPDPFAEVPRYATEPQRREALERDELLKVIGLATGELRRLFIIATFTGLRMGDCACLEWSDVHLPHNRLIRRTAKTGKTVAFPLHPDLRAELDATPPELRRGPVCPDMAARYAKDPTALSKLTAKVFASAELQVRADPSEGRRRAICRRGFHSFRHSFATQCARAGVPIGLVKEWLGHSSPVVTAIYEHWRPDRDGGQILQALPALNPAPVDEKRQHLLEEAAKLLSTATDRQLLKAISDLKGGKR